MAAVFSLPPGPLPMRRDRTRAGSMPSRLTVEAPPFALSPLPSAPVATTAAAAAMASLPPTVRPHEQQQQRALMVDAPTLAQRWRDAFSLASIRTVLSPHARSPQVSPLASSPTSGALRLREALAVLTSVVLMLLVALELLGPLFPEDGAAISIAAVPSAPSPPPRVPTGGDDWHASSSSLTALVFPSRRITWLKLACVTLSILLSSAYFLSSRAQLARAERQLQRLLMQGRLEVTRRRWWPLVLGMLHVCGEGGTWVVEMLAAWRRHHQRLRQTRGLSMSAAGKDAGGIGGAGAVADGSARAMASRQPELPQLRIRTGSAMEWLAVNGTQPIAIESEYFHGHCLVLVRNDGETAEQQQQQQQQQGQAAKVSVVSSAWHHLFAGNSHHLRVQVQGRFKRALPPHSVAYMAVELPVPTPASSLNARHKAQEEETEKKMKMAPAETAARPPWASFLATSIRAVLLTMLETVLPAAAHVSSGHDLDAELPHVAVPLYQFVDELVATPLSCDGSHDQLVPTSLPQLGRQTLGEQLAQRQRRRNTRIGHEPAFRTDTVYSFQFHTQYLDFARWSLAHMPMGVPNLSLARVSGVASSSSPPPPLIRLAVYTLSVPVNAPSLLHSLAHNHKDKRYLMVMSVEHDPTALHWDRPPVSTTEQTEEEETPRSAPVPASIRSARIVDGMAMPLSRTAAMYPTRGRSRGRSPSEPITSVTEQTPDSVTRLAESAARHVLGLRRWRTASYDQAAPLARQECQQQQQEEKEDTATMTSSSSWSSSSSSASGSRGIAGLTPRTRVRALTSPSLSVSLSMTSSAFASSTSTSTSSVISSSRKSTRPPPSHVASPALSRSASFPTLLTPPPPSSPPFPRLRTASSSSASVRSMTAQERAADLDNWQFSVPVWIELVDRVAGNRKVAYLIIAHPHQQHQHQHHQQRKTVVRSAATLRNALLLMDTDPIDDHPDHHDGPQHVARTPVQRLQHTRQKQRRQAARAFKKLVVEAREFQYAQISRETEDVAMAMQTIANIPDHSASELEREQRAMLYRCLMSDAQLACIRSWQEIGVQLTTSTRAQMTIVLERGVYRMPEPQFLRQEWCILTTQELLFYRSFTLRAARVFQLDQMLSVQAVDGLTILDHTQQTNSSREQADGGSPPHQQQQQQQQHGAMAATTPTSASLPPRALRPHLRGPRATNEWFCIQVEFLTEVATFFVDSERDRVDYLSALSQFLRARPRGEAARGLNGVRHHATDADVDSVAETEAAGATAAMDSGSNEQSARVSLHSRLPPLVAIDSISSPVDLNRRGQLPRGEQYAHSRTYAPSPGCTHLGDSTKMSMRMAPTRLRGLNGLELAEEALRRGLHFYGTPREEIEPSDLLSFLEAVKHLNEVTLLDMGSRGRQRRMYEDDATGMATMAQHGNGSHVVYTSLRSDAVRMAFAMNVYHTLVIHAWVLYGDITSHAQWKKIKMLPFYSIRIQSSTSTGNGNSSNPITTGATINGVPQYEHRIRLTLADLEYTVLRACASASDDRFLAESELTRKPQWAALLTVRQRDFRASLALQLNTFTHGRRRCRTAIHGDHDNEQDWTTATLMRVFHATPATTFQRELEETCAVYLAREIALDDGARVIYLPKICEWNTSDYGSATPAQMSAGSRAFFCLQKLLPLMHAEQQTHVQRLLLGAGKACQFRYRRFWTHDLSISPTYGEPDPSTSVAQGDDDEVEDSIHSIPRNRSALEFLKSLFSEN